MQQSTHPRHIRGYQPVALPQLHRIARCKLCRLLVGFRIIGAKQVSPLSNVAVRSDETGAILLHSIPAEMALPRRAARKVQHVLSLVIG